MPDPTENPEQPNNPGQQVDWEARYKGSVRKVEELTLANRALEAKVTELTNAHEQTKTQLSGKDVEKEVALNQANKTLREKEEALVQQGAELKLLRGLKAKVDALKKAGRPDLFEVIDTIPAVDDPAAMEAVIKSLADFATNVEKRREQQLMAGVVPPTGNIQTPTPQYPTSEREWQAFINKLPFGSPERQKAMDAMWTWGMSQK